MPLPWYALHVASNCEHQVIDRLDQAGVEGFYPHVMVKSRRHSRPDVPNKFFPGYCFAAFNLAERTPVIQIPQIIRILGWAHSPVQIPDSEIAAIRTMTLSAPASVAACPYVVAGQPVVITRGPLQGLEGFVAYMKNVKNKVRVVVSVSMLQRSISAEVDAGDIEIIQRAPQMAA